MKKVLLLLWKVLLVSLGGMKELRESKGIVSNRRNTAKYTDFHIFTSQVS